MAKKKSAKATKKPAPKKSAGTKNLKEVAKRTVKKPVKKIARAIDARVVDVPGCCIINIHGNFNKTPGVSEDDCREMAGEFDGATWTWVTGPCPP